MYGLNKYMIDINIETLAGTTFSLKVSPLEPIQSVKAKIQRLEGIPISHQHLVWKTTELEDTLCLNDYNIPNGATIKMVLALRGGPINTRRMTTEDSLLRDVSDLMEIREDSNLWNNNDSSNSINKHVTLLLFRDGDHLNLLRVIDRGDAASPISGAMSAASMYVPYDETDHERILTNNASNTAPDGTLIESDVKLNNKKIKYKKSLTNENEKTREKMIALRDKMNEYKKQKTRSKLSNDLQASATTTTATSTITTNNSINKTHLKPEALNIKQEIDQNESNELKQDQLVQQQNHSAKINPTSGTNRTISNNLRMKRFQIIGDSSKLLPSNDLVNKKLSSATNGSDITTTLTKEEKPNNTNNSTNTINNVNTKQAKTKMTTIYTTTDRNGQVFIKKIHENYAELAGEEMGDDEVDEEDQEDEDLDSDEELEDEYDENYDEEGVDYEANLLKNYNCYYDDEYFVDDGEVDYDDADVDDEDDEEDDEDDDEDDDVDDDLDDDDEDEDDDLDDELDDEDDVEQRMSETKLKTAKSDYDENVPICEDDYDEDENENELLLNKSELLINEDRQTNNSPNIGGVNETKGSSGGVAGSADLMTMMMMMTLNSDQLSLNGGAASGIGIHGGISSSLATTALPTILTPMYNTDNENFHHPPTRSAMKKIKNIRVSNNKKAQSLPNQIKVAKTKRSKPIVNVNNTLDIIQLETNNNLKLNTNHSPKIESTNISENSNPELEKLKQIENLEQEERLAAARLQKQKRKKRRIQLQLQQLKDQELQNKLSSQESTSDQQQQNEAENTKKENDNEDTNNPTSSTNQQRRNNPRRRRRREYTDSKPNIQFSSILLLPEEIESIKRRIKEGIELKQQQQLNSRQSRNQTSLKLSNDKEKSILVESDKSQQTSDTQVENTKVITPPNHVHLEETQTKTEIEPNQQVHNQMPSTLQKKVSFIVTPTDEDKTNQSLSSNDLYLDKMKKILKSSPNVSNNTNPINKTTASLQAKVFNNDLQQQQQIKPLLLTNYKQKPPPKLDSLYSSNEIVTFSNVNNKFYQQQQQDLSNESNNTSNKIYGNLNTTKSYPNESSLHTIPTQTNMNLLKRNSAALRNISTPTSSPTTTANTSTSINRLDILKNNLAYSGNSVIKNYSSNYANNQTTKYNETTSVEPLRLSSASARANKPVSLSSNDLSTKALKLPPVITNTNPTNSNSTNIIIGSSTNNLTSIGLNETTTSKKKITDLSRYCFFCQRKTGLASSYICRCGNNYCTQHRNAEAHNCTFDYKTEGRKLIEHSNPLVAAPKLPKI